MLSCSTSGRLRATVRSRRSTTRTQRSASGLTSSASPAGRPLHPSPVHRPVADALMLIYEREGRLPSASQARLDAIGFEWAARKQCGSQFMAGSPPPTPLSPPPFSFMAVFVVFLPPSAPGRPISLWLSGASSHSACRLPGHSPFPSTFYPLSQSPNILLSAERLSRTR